MSTSAAVRGGEERGWAAVAVLMPRDSARRVRGRREEAERTLRALRSCVDRPREPRHRGERLVGQLVVGEALDLEAGGAQFAVAAVVLVAALLAEVPAAAVGLGDRVVLAEEEVDAVAAEQRHLHVGIGEERLADE